jgi:hypothetical protein
LEKSILPVNAFAALFCQIKVIGKHLDISLLASRKEVKTGENLGNLRLPFKKQDYLFHTLLIHYVGFIQALSINHP